MNYIIEFYKGLDTVNLIIFWGVIIVIVLLLVFAIIISNKNKELVKIIESKSIDIDEYDENDIPTLKADNTSLKFEEETIKNEVVKANNAVIDDTINNNYFFKNDENVEEEITEKKESFNAEEYISDYNQTIHEIDNNTNKSNIIIDNNISETIPSNQPYQKNVLNEMSLNQTSPIGIIKTNDTQNKEIQKAEELYNSFNEKNNSNVNTANDNNQRNINNSSNNYYKRGNYLEELSKKSSDIKEGINRTEYELKQEEDAIISYQELMQKKDQLQIIDEEEAIISVNELLNTKNKNEKLYNISDNEENDKFIDELKDFRSGL